MHATTIHTIEDQIRDQVASRGEAPIVLVQLLAALAAAPGASRGGDARADIDGLAKRLGMNYHINGPQGMAVFRAASPR